MPARLPMPAVALSMYVMWNPTDAAGNHGGLPLRCMRGILCVIGIFMIQGPFHGIVCDVGSHVMQFPFMSDHPFKRVTLPDFMCRCVLSHPFGDTDFESTND